MSEITTAVETVTPEVAAMWLTRNCSENRNLSRGRVEELARAILQGQWRLTHQGIAFGENGDLIDGQHRLAAIVRAGVPVQILVTRGLPQSSFSVMDRGWTRSLRDIASADVRIVDACAFLARLHGVTYVQSHHVDAIAASPVGEAMLRLKECAGGVQRRRTVASVLVSAALRWFSDSDYVESQWAALVHLQYQDMSAAMQAFCRQTEGGVSGRRTSSNDILARAWVAFDPEKREISKILIRDISVITEEIRSIYQPPWKTEGAK